MLLKGGLLICLSEEIYISHFFIESLRHLIMLIKCKQIVGPLWTITFNRYCEVAVCMDNRDCFLTIDIVCVIG